MKKGVDVGGTFIKVLWEDGRKEKVYVRELSQNREQFLKKLREVVSEGKPSKVGVAVAGFTSLEGIVHRSPNIPALDGVNVSEILVEENIEGVVMNDVSAGAFGEWFYDHKDSKNLLFVAVGTGLGAGFVSEGKVFLGSCGSALELGHHVIERGGFPCSCGRKGCLEAYCSSYGLQRLYETFSGRKLRDYEVVQRAKRGEKEALKSIEAFKEYLLLGLMNAVHIFNPDLVVLGGGLIDQLMDFLGDLEVKLKGTVESLPSKCLKVRFSKCGEFCVARGALALTLVSDL